LAEENTWKIDKKFTEIEKRVRNGGKEWARESFLEIRIAGDWVE
jgi:hypothetical protein